MLSSEERANTSADIKAIADATLIETAIVYSSVGSPTGRYDQVVKAGVACRLSRPSLTSGGPVRAEEAAQRELRWSRTYTLPETGVRLEISGVRWSPIAGSFQAVRGPDGTTVYNSCLVVRAATT